MSIEILPQSQLSFHRPFTQLVKEIIIWAITSKDLINEKKLRCEYLPPVGNNPFPTLTSPIHSHNIAEPFRNDDDDPAKLRRQLLEAKDEITRLNNMIENYKQELNTTQMRQRKDEEAAASFEKLSNYYLKLLNDKEDFNLIDPQKEALSSSSPTSHTEEESDVDKNDPSNEVIMQLINMGFSKAQAIDALEKNNYDPYQAITYLLDSDI
ncbi:VAMP-associated protein [Gigaspora margarita]|uniref:VAMP-associated protein n=1 Tax=Gigaspora margarita TaxID=4874 RepID=A0A8H4AXP2_GIGMA|nr:VAMP-associated protein [Gigaspora margarita]